MPRIRQRWCEKGVFLCQIRTDPVPVHPTEPLGGLREAPAWGTRELAPVNRRDGHIEPVLDHAQHNT